MSNGLDCFSNCKDIAINIKNAGYSFVCRYYNTIDTSKNLTLEEAKALSTAGLYIVSVWENGSPTTYSYFSFDKGLSDGNAAFNYAMNTIRQTDGTPIYFTVDYDASDSDLTGNVSSYFLGVAGAFANNNATYGKSYKIGVYGSGATCSYIYNHNNYVGYTWLSMSSGWRGYSTYTSWNIKQGGTTRISSIDFDKDISNGSAGGFKVAF